MTMTISKISFFTLYALCFFPFSANCLAKHKEQSIEITPFTGYRIAGEFNNGSESEEISLKDNNSHGLIIAWPFDHTRQGELLISKYSTEFSHSTTQEYNNNSLDISYIHLGGNVPISQGVLPFWLNGGLGATYFSPKDSSLDDETKFSFHLGLATKLAISDRISLRINSTAYGTLFDTESTVFCQADNCAIYVSSDVWWQAELTVGLTFKF